MNLDDRIFPLQKTNLPPDLRQLLFLADREQLQDSDEVAEAIVRMIEVECEHRGIALFRLDALD